MTVKTKQTFPERETEYIIREEKEVFLIENGRRGRFANGNESGCKKPDDSR